MHCTFCTRFCMVEFTHWIERSFAELLAWRAHLLADGIAREGLDPVLWLPRVLTHGTLDAALYAHTEDS